MASSLDTHSTPIQRTEHQHGGVCNAAHLNRASESLYETET
ncbi:hypothetical protein OG874_16545 [Nocardia sp. NBC_00565]|nr:hypothetical protein [Nocardia sp. NBC_00565]WUC06628.1 hypothetical protein OG874_16545 [Nocardia sp. NBC_00565]